MKRRAVWALASLLSLLPAGARAGGDETAQVLFGHRIRYRQLLVFDGALGYAPLSGPLAVSSAAWLMWQRTRSRNVGCGTFVITSESRLYFGAGLRFTQVMQFGNATFTGRGDATGQALVVRQPWISALNVAVQGRVRLLNVRHHRRHPLFFGINLDLAGGSLGPTRATASAEVAAPPARVGYGNLLLINTNDRGTLSSEFFLAYKASRRLTVRAGLMHLAGGYTVAGNRYQRFSNLAFAGLTYTPRRTGRFY